MYVLTYKTSSKWTLFNMRLTTMFITAVYFQGQVSKRVWIFEARSENGCGKWQFWSQIISGFGEAGGTRSPAAHPTKSRPGSSVSPPRAPEWVSNTFAYRRRLRPWSNPLPFYIPFFQKRHPFRTPFIGTRHPFHLPSYEDLSINR